MRKFAGNYLSGRVKTTPPADVTDDRYLYLGLDQAEPNLGKPTGELEALGDECFVMSNTDGTRLLVSLGDDLDLVDILDDQQQPSGFKRIDLSGTAEQTFTTNTISAVNLQQVLDTGAKAQTAMLIANIDRVDHTTILVASQGFGNGTPVAGKIYRIVSAGSGVNWESLDDAADVVKNNKSYSTGALIKLKSGVQPLGTSGSMRLQPSIETFGGAQIGKDLVLSGITSPAQLTGDTNGIYFRDGSGTQKVNRIRAYHAQASGQTYMELGPTGVSTSFKIYENSATMSAPNYTTIDYTTSKISLSDDTDSDAKSIIQGAATIEIDPYPHANIGGKVVINGDLDVQGTQTTINSQTLDVVDNVITVASNVDSSANTSGAGLQFGGTWTTGTNPTITWFDNSTVARVKVNKDFETSGIYITGRTAVTEDPATTIGYLRSDGTIDTNSYVDLDDNENTTYGLDTDTKSTSDNDGKIILTGSDNTVNNIIIQGDNGITVSTQAFRPAGTDPGQSSDLDAIITIDGASVTPRTYTMATEDVVDETRVNIRLDSSSDTDADDSLVGLDASGNISITRDGTSGVITFGDDLTPTYSGADAVLTINNTTQNDFDVAYQTADSGQFTDGIALDVNSNTPGIVARFSRDNTSAYSGGGVVQIEAPATSNSTQHRADPWLTFRNSTDSILDPADTPSTGATNTMDNTDRTIMGEITNRVWHSSTDYPNYSGILGGDTGRKSGIRIWGHSQIDFAVATTRNHAGGDNSNGGRSANDNAVSIVPEGLVIWDGYAETGNQITAARRIGGSTDDIYTLTLKFTNPGSPNNTILLPDVDGTLATLDDVASAGINVTDEESSTFEHNILFTNGTGNDKTALGSSELRFNPNTGTLSATAKSFVIDHPTKQSMKLQYACLEGPENGVYVRGRLHDDDTIELPDYWTELVDESTITVNLTPMGCSQQLYVQEIVDNKVIVGSDSQINCFYTVFAERKDIEKLVVEYEDK